MKNRNIAACNGIVDRTIRRLRINESIRVEARMTLKSWRNWALRRAPMIRRGGAAIPGRITARELFDRCTFYGWRCVYCLQDLSVYDVWITYFGRGIYHHEGAPLIEMDHRIPLAKGGSHWPANLVPSCIECNMRKGSLLPPELLQ